MAKLENRYCASRSFLRYDYPPQQSKDADPATTIETLRQESTELRQRLGQFLQWESALDEPQRGQVQLRSQTLLSLGECHAIAHLSYAEIRALSSCGGEGSISTGT